MTVNRGRAVLHPLAHAARFPEAAESVPRGDAHPATADTLTRMSTREDVVQSLRYLEHALQGAGSEVRHGVTHIRNPDSAEARLAILEGQIEVLTKHIKLLTALALEESNDAPGAFDGLVP
jgi:hypothetical protein